MANDSRLETEKEFLAILALHNEMFEVLQVKPHYLSNKKHHNLLSLMIDSYKQNGSIVPKDLMVNSEYIDYVLELYDTQLITASYRPCITK